MTSYCMRCGAPIGDGINFCGKCGNPVLGQPGSQPGQVPYYGNPGMYVKVPGADKKVTAGVLGLLLGGLGIHKFYLGYSGAGIIQILAGIFSCGLFAIVGHVEGIIYLTKSDQEFVDTYVNGRKEWF